MKRLSSIRLAAAVTAVSFALVSCNAIGQFADRIGGSDSEASEVSDNGGGGRPAEGGTTGGRSASGGGGRPGGGGGRPGGGPPGRPVSTEAASVQTRSQIIQVGGRLRPLTRIDHQVPVTGLVREVAVETGDRVSVGTILYTIEREEIGQTFRPVPVEARISGVVSDVEIQAAQQVRTGDAAVAVVGDDGFMLEAQVSDKDASNVQVGATVIAHTVDDVELDGTLSLRAAEPDYETGLFSVTFSFDSDQPAGIGSFLVIDLPTQDVEGIFVSRDSVDRRYGRYYLWVVDEEASVFTRREVTLGEIIDDAVVVETGLEVGERYITRLSGREREGAPAPPPAEREGAPAGAPAAAARQG